MKKRLTKLVKPVESPLPAGELQLHTHHPNGTPSPNIRFTGAVSVRDRQVIDCHMTEMTRHMTMYNADNGTLVWSYIFIHL